MGELVSTLDESLSGIKVIKSYNAVDYIKQKFYDLNADLARLTFRWRAAQLASPMSEFLGISAVGVILVFGGSLVFKVAQPRRLHRLRRHVLADHAPVRTFIDQFANINQGIAAGSASSIIDAQSEIQDKPGALELNGLKERSNSATAHFSYDGSRR
ncbi:MAG: ABC transporter transmembrane domain-containing protein [Alistipes finegoldii]